MRVALVAHGGPGIGVGHVVRAVALAQEARSRGHDVTLAGWVDGPFLTELLAHADLPVVPLSADAQSAEMLAALGGGAGAGVGGGAGAGGGAETGGGAGAGALPDVIHVDTYRLHDDLLAALAERSERVLLSAMEDSEFGRRPAHVVVDSTIGADEVARPGVPARWLALGARYTPLRTDISRLRGRRDGGAAAREGVARDAVAPGDAAEDADGRLRVLVVMGGADPTGLTPRVLDVLGRTGVPLAVTAVVQPAAQAAVAEVAATHPGLALTVTPPTGSLPELYTTHDVVVSASGTSVWELCCVQVPMALVCAVDNQVEGYRRVIDAGAALGLGGPAFDLAEQDTAVTGLREWLSPNAFDDRQNAARRAGELVDELGAYRVVRTWEVAATAGRPRTSEGLTVRGATLDDARTLFDWRNDPQTRALSRSSDELVYDDHVAWLRGSLERDDRVLLIVTGPDGGQVGTVRWDHEGHDDWEVSITVAPSARGQGLATPMLLAAEEHLAQTADVRSYLAVVHADNEPSRRLFATADYVADLPPDAAGFERYRKRPTRRPS